MFKHVFKIAIVRFQNEAGGILWMAYIPALIDDGAMFLATTRQEALVGIESMLKKIVTRYRKDGKPLPDMNQLEQVTFNNLEGVLAMNDVAAFQDFEKREKRSRKGKKVGLKVYVLDPEKNNMQ